MSKRTPVMILPPDSDLPGAASPQSKQAQKRSVAKFPPVLRVVFSLLLAIVRPATKGVFSAVVPSLIAIAFGWWFLHWIVAPITGDFLDPASWATWGKTLIEPFVNGNANAVDFPPN